MGTLLAQAMLLQRLRGTIQQALATGVCMCRLGEPYSLRAAVRPAAASAAIPRQDRYSQCGAQGNAWWARTVLGG